jgi:excisionase family DNA binding protein
MEQLFLQGINLDKLLDKIGELIDKRLNLNETKAKEISKFLSRKETATILKISLPTLHDWTKIGLIQSYKIGNRVLYKVAEIEEAVKKVSTIKHRRAIL